MSESKKHKAKVKQKRDYPRGFRFLFLITMPLWLIVGMEVLLNIDTRRSSKDYAVMIGDNADAIHSLAIKDEIIVNKINLLSKRIDQVSNEMDLVLQTYLPKIKSDSKNKNKDKISTNDGKDEKELDETSSLKDIEQDKDEVAQVRSFEEMSYEQEIITAGITDISDRTAMLEEKLFEVNEVIKESNSNNLSNNLILSSVRLREAVNSSKEFEAELATLKLFATGEERILQNIAILEKYAASGILNVESLKRDFDSVAGEIINLSRKQNPDPTILDQIAIQLSSLVQVRKIGGNVSGNNADDILARSYNYLLKSDLKNAVKEMNRLTEDLKVIATPWLNKAKAHIESTEASDAIFSYVTDIKVTG